MTKRKLEAPRAKSFTKSHQPPHHQVNAQEVVTIQRGIQSIYHPIPCMGTRTAVMERASGRCHEPDDRRPIASPSLWSFSCLRWDFFDGMSSPLILLRHVCSPPPRLCEFCGGMATNPAPASEHYDYLLKLLLIGDSGVCLFGVWLLLC
jgi:hypothetical protein